MSQPTGAAETPSAYLVAHRSRRATRVRYRYRRRFGAIDTTTRCLSISAGRVCAVVTRAHVGASVWSQWQKPPIPIIAAGAGNAAVWWFLTLPPTDTESLVWQTSPVLDVAVPVWRGTRIPLPTPGVPGRSWVRGATGTAPSFGSIVTAVAANDRTPDPSGMSNPGLYTPAPPTAG